jgi:hypothetical protein
MLDDSSYYALQGELGERAFSIDFFDVCTEDSIIIGSLWLHVNKMVTLPALKSSQQHHSIIYHIISHHYHITLFNLDFFIVNNTQLY